jgi:alkanesulfonate monooxygenase SsuD/methylene tetrahydromethanopterin reductase-like flavin-dependent oxidoreductase (luciferase family)
VVRPLCGGPSADRHRLDPQRRWRRYQALGIDSFILSGYPHRDECERFARLVLPRLRSSTAFN